MSLEISALRVIFGGAFLVTRAIAGWRGVKQVSFDGALTGDGALSNALSSRDGNEAGFSLAWQVRLSICWRRKPAKIQIILRQ